MSAGLVKLRTKPVNAGVLVPIRMRALGGRVLLTNPWGDWLVLDPDEFDRVASGPLEPGPLYDKLAARQFLRDRIDASALSERMVRYKSFANHGPNMHIVIPTLRCNQTCVYCHASRADFHDTSRDMSSETADRVVEFVFQSTSPRITIEFQGGEPLANFPIVQRIIERALERNRAAQKTLDFTLVTNLSLLDEERLEFLVRNRVQICTSIDGPASLHDKQRVLAGGSSHAQAVRWIKRINEAYAAMGLDPVLYHVEALLTTTRQALQHPREIVDTYLELGCRAIFLRPLDPFGFAAHSARAVAYEPEAFLDFYRAALEYILQLNRQGEQVLERFAAIFLTKILDGEQPNYLDLRSPCGAGIGQLAYDYDGTVFTCDEGRMVHHMGDSFFALGRVGQDSYRSMMLSDTVRAMALASNLDAQPGCVDCVYQPYCGVCPVHSYATQGSIFGRMRESSLCAVYKGIQDQLFLLLSQGDATTEAILRRWTTVRDRAHFLQSPASAGA